MVVLVFGFVLFIVCVGCTIGCQLATRALVKHARKEEDGPLLDLLHCESLRWVERWRGVPDITVFLYVAGFTWLRGVEALANAMPMYTAICILRCICFTVTILPHTRPVRKDPFDGLPWYGVIFHALTKGHIYDKNFSGHVALLVLVALHLHEHVGWFVQVSMWSWTVAMSLAIAVMRCHYTIDVITAWMAAPLVFLSLK